MSKYITKVTSIYFVDDLGDEKFIWKCTALPNAYTICEILNADLIKNGMYSIWKYKELIEKNLQIADLEAKLAESEERCTKMWKWEVQQINRFQEENNQLKQQLAEKDEEIKHRHWAIKSGVYIQDKISFAVEQLEQLKHDIWTDQQDNGWLDEQVDIYFLTETIDNQIKQLTHQHEDKGEKDDRK